MLTYNQISVKLLFASKLSYKKSKSVKYSFYFQEASTCKRQGHADLLIPDINRVKWVLQQLRKVIMWVLSTVIIIAQSYTRNIEYVIG